ncbi:MAG: hypothetical protein HMLKMBBP_01537 [Planctomycetes bacterium]|nr:hypothetical protein [Planctomycetota bacterium]
MNTKLCVATWTVIFTAGILLALVVVGMAGLYVMHFIDEAFGVPAALVLLITGAIIWFFGLMGHCLAVDHCKGRRSDDT